MNDTDARAAREAVEAATLLTARLSSWVRSQHNPTEVHPTRWVWPPWEQGHPHGPGSDVDVTYSDGSHRILQVQDMPAPLRHRY